jgi:hypothetical protein
MKYIFIHIEVQDGERRLHDHKVLHTTNCNNVGFAVEWYVAHYWGYGERIYKDEWWWWGDFCGRVKSWSEITKEEFNILNKYL